MSQSDDSHREVPGTDNGRILLMRLAGGLGNQLFQYAFGYALAAETGRKLLVRGNRLGTFADPQPYQLNIFGVQEAAEPEGTREILEYWGFTAEAHLTETKQIVSASPCDIMELGGYWQNEAGFHAQREALRRKLLLPPLPLAEVEDRTPVCLQVRRGIFQKIELHNCCDETYFLNAIRVIKAFIPNPHFIVVSDGIDWCRSFLKEPHVSFYGTVNEAHDYRVMNACRAFIISNSSYGWWPAWITDSPVVVRPSRWINTPDWTALDWRVYPERWIGLPCGMRAGDGSLGSFLENPSSISVKETA